MLNRRLFSLCFILLISIPFYVSADGVVYPEAIHVTDVTKPPYRAIPNDGLDDTTAIQHALLDLSGHQFGMKTLYLPNGIYNVSDTLRWSIEDSTLRLRGNAWKKVALNYSITPDTILEFNFRSSKQGESHAIGFDTDDNRENDSNRFQLFGTEDLTHSQTAFRNYEISDGWKHYRIPVGAHFKGAMTAITFISDDDAAGEANSFFRHVHLFEGTSQTLALRFDEERVVPYTAEDGAGGKRGERMVYGGEGRYFTMRGQSRDGVIIRLADNLPTFGNPAKPKAVLDTVHGGNEAFRSYLQDLTVDVGKGNPGAVGVDWIASNIGALRDVKVVSSDPEQAGRYGFAFTKTWPGPQLVKNIEAVGFDYGVFVTQGQYQITFENVSLSKQRIAGFHNASNSVAARKIESNNAVPALQLGESARMALLDGTFRGGAPTTVAIQLDNETNLYARNITAEGYQSVLRKGDATTSGLNIDEYISQAAVSLFDGPKKSLSLEIRETPTYENWNPDDWAIIDHRAQENDAPALQAAMNSGKPVVALSEVTLEQLDRSPGYVGNWVNIRTPVRIPRTVRLFHAMDQPIDSSRWAGGDSAMFIIEGDRSDPPLIIERCSTGYHYGGGRGPRDRWLLEGSRTVIFKDSESDFIAGPNAGDIFFENVVCGGTRGIQFNPGQKIWARQFNTEDLRGSTQPLVRNNGANLWILGQKTEGPKRVIETVNGGRTELLGGHYYPTDDVPAGVPLFINIDSSFSAAAFVMINYGARNYSIVVRETRGGETRELSSRKMDGWAGLYTGYEPKK